MRETSTDTAKDWQGRPWQGNNVGNGSQKVATYLTPPEGWTLEEWLNFLRQDDY